MGEASLYCVPPQQDRTQSGHRCGAWKGQVSRPQCWLGRALNGAGDLTSSIHSFTQYVASLSFSLRLGVLALPSRCSESNGGGGETNVMREHNKIL